MLLQLVPASPQLWVCWIEVCHRNDGKKNWIAACRSLCVFPAQPMLQVRLKVLLERLKSGSSIQISHMTRFLTTHVLLLKYDMGYWPFKMFQLRRNIWIDLNYALNRLRWFSSWGTWPQPGLTLCYDSILTVYHQPLLATSELTIYRKITLFFWDISDVDLTLSRVNLT